MSVAIITGSAGLIGSEASEFFAQQGFDIVGIDNNLRELFLWCKCFNSLAPPDPREKIGQAIHTF